MTAKKDEREAIERYLNSSMLAIERVRKVHRETHLSTADSDNDIIVTIIRESSHYNNIRTVNLTIWVSRSQIG